MRTLRALVVLSLVGNLLLAVLVLTGRNPVAVLPRAEAQAAPGGRLVAVAGRVSNNEDVVYVFNEDKGRVTVLMWDDSDDELEVLAYENLSEYIRRLDRAEGKL